jgi:hypothetical protein
MPNTTFTKGGRTLFGHHLVIDQVKLAKMAKARILDQSSHHGYANQINQ